VVAPLLVAAGFVAGFVVGRWWVLSEPAALSVYVAAASEVDEVPPWFLGVLYGLLGAAAVAAGVLIRRLFRRV
jgi:hypothetical protein